MSKTRRITVSISNRLLQDIDGVVTTRNSTRSEIIREAMKYYLQEVRRRDFIDQMRKGYQEMAEMNLRLAQEGLVLENEADPTLQINWGGVSR